MERLPLNNKIDIISLEKWTRRDTYKGLLHIFFLETIDHNFSFDIVKWIVQTGNKHNKPKNQVSRSNRSQFEIFSKELNRQTKIDWFKWIVQTRDKHNKPKNQVSRSNISQFEFFSKELNRETKIDWFLLLDSQRSIQNFKHWLS